MTGEPHAANEFGSGLGPSAGGEPEVSGLPATGTSAAWRDYLLALSVPLAMVVGGIIGWLAVKL